METGAAAIFARHGSKLIQGARYAAQLLRHRVPVLHGHHIKEARGRERVSGAVFARTGPDGRFLAGTEKFRQVDSLAVGHGFVPNIELPVQAGCRVTHDPDLGGWAAAVNADMETSVTGIYAVGETAGIGGAEQSRVQGELAGMAILEQLGRIHRRQPRWDRFVKKRHRLYQRSDECRSYGALLNRICRVPAAAYGHIPDDTVICRCETSPCERSSRLSRTDSLPGAASRNPPAAAWADARPGHAAPSSSKSLRPSPAQIRKPSGRLFPGSR